MRRRAAQDGKLTRAHPFPVDIQCLLTCNNYQNSSGILFVPMTDSRENDPVWQTAVDWVLRVHGSSLDPETTATLAAWLAQDPAHRTAYEEAARVWLLTGLVPPSADDDTPST